MREGRHDDLFDRLWQDEQREEDEYAKRIDIERAERAAEQASIPVVVSPPNSRNKGARAETEFIAQHLAQHWPLAMRNLNQYGFDKRDCLDVDGLHFQIKRVEKLNIWAALAQAERDAGWLGEAGAQNIDIPLVAFRRNRGIWYVAGPAVELLPILAARGRF